MSPEGGRPTVGSGAELTVAAAIPALIANLALELAPGVVEPADVAALAVHVMSNTALTGATYTIDGGQRLVSA
jgi:hypothetical protein